ncbi:unnamed protein product, partial [Didymodactylos carnosus]
PDRNNCMSVKNQLTEKKKRQQNVESRLSLAQINEVLNGKGGITSIARELFKEIVPVDRRQVDHWNKLPIEVLLIEKMLIDFMERYYSPVEVNPKKFMQVLSDVFEINVAQKKQQQQGDAHDGDEKDSYDVEQTDDAIEDENSHRF